MDERRPVNLAAAGLMALICLIWALQSIGLKFTAADASPVLQIGLRSGFAAVLVWIVITIKGQRVQWFGNTAAFGALAGVMFALNYYLVGEALIYTSASHVVVFVYTAPIFAALGLHIRIPTERLVWAQWLGIAIAASGIAYAFLWSSDQAAGAQLRSALWGDMLALLAGLVWGASTILVRVTPLRLVPATIVVFYQLVAAFVVLTIIPIVTGSGHVVWTWALVMNLGFQGVCVSFFSFLIWFWLLTQYKASQLGVFAFMTPILGVLLGYSLLGEPITFEFLIGSICVLAGIAIVSAYPWIAGTSKPIQS